MIELAEKLLSAHVQHELARLQGDPLSRTLEEQVSATFRWFAQIKLDDVATHAQIIGVMERYVSEFRVGGGIAELAGEMAQLVLSSPASASTRVDQILPDASYEEFATKLVGLSNAWHELFKLVSESAAFAEISGQLVSRALVGLMLARKPARSKSRSALARKLQEQVLPAAAQRLTKLITRSFAKQKQRFAQESQKHMVETLDPVRLRAILDEIWDAVSPMRLSEAFALIDGYDLEDLVVLGYEFWQGYRKSDYFRQISSEMVEHFFEKYGQGSVASLIEDMGVNEQMVGHELITFLGPIFARARETGFLEQHIRARLEPFYRSPALNEILRDHQPG
jgi:hypothetical protein